MSETVVTTKWDAPWIARLTAYKALPGNDMGGSLHIYIEDGNCQRHDLVYCRQWATDHGDAVGAELAADLLNLTKGQRHHLYRKMLGTLMSKCATCGTPVQRSTAAAIVWTTPPQMWCFACWDGGDTAAGQYRDAQVADTNIVGVDDALR